MARPLDRGRVVRVPLPTGQRVFGRVIRASMYDINTYWVQFPRAIQEQMGVRDQQVTGWNKAGHPVSGVLSFKRRELVPTRTKLVISKQFHRRFNTPKRAGLDATSIKAK
jgi:hypothetical protein